MSQQHRKPAQRRVHASVARLCAVGLTALTALAAMAPPAAAQSPAPQAPAGAPTTADNFVTLNGTWQFALGANADEAGKLADFHRPGFNLAAFKPMPVPSNWVMHGYDKPQYKSWKGEAAEGFYVRHFTVPSSWTERRTLLHFDGVWSSAEVWLNGQPLGRHDNGFNKISYEISNQLKPGADNVLAVRVRQVSPEYVLDTNDDWALGGIYRDVTLESMPKLGFIDRAEVQTEFDQYYRDADLKVRVMVNDQRKRKESTVIMDQGDPYTLRLSLFDAAGKLVQTQDTTVPAHAGAGGETALAMRVKKPLQWNAETPNLYGLSIQLVEGGKVVHTRNVKVGFREISTKGGIFRVNGQAVKLRGTNRHDEHPDVGRATRQEHWRQDLELMKAGNINYLRLAHYVPAEGFLDLCDELGMYVSNEISMGFGGDDLYNHPERAAAILDRTYRSVTRDINHPSVVIWSVGNEDPLSTLHMASLRTTKALDPSRPVLLPLRAEATLPKDVDIRAPHYWSAAMYDEQAARSDRPIVTTEFSHAYGVEGFGGFEDRWKALTRHAAGAGGAMWLWADQGLTVVKRKPDGTEERSLNLPQAHFDGIVDSYRRPTRDYWEAKAVYAQVNPAVDALAVTPGQATLRLPVQNDFDFTNLSAVKLAWQLKEDDRTLATGTLAGGGVPHALAWFEVPLTALREFKPRATYYVTLTATHADGSEISRRSVELQPTTAVVAAPAVALAAPVVASEGGALMVRAGAATYRFNPASGELGEASYQGAPRIARLQPTLWRTLNHTETLKMTEKRVDLNAYTASVSQWKVEQGQDHVAIRATVRYTVDASNRFTVDYTYRVNAAGALTVQYSVMPAVQAAWLPHVGMELHTAPGFDRLRWLGLGPLDAYPNMKAAATLGVYAERIGERPDEQVMKATRWAELGNSAGAAIRVQNDGYLNYVAAETGRVRILSSVVGRQTKADRPEEPCRVETTTGQPFVGAFTIELPR